MKWGQLGLWRCAWTQTQEQRAMESASQRGSAGLALWGSPQAAHPVEWQRSMFILSLQNGLKGSGQHYKKSPWHMRPSDMHINLRNALHGQWAWLWRHIRSASSWMEAIATSRSATAMTDASCPLVSQQYKTATFNKGNTVVRLKLESYVYVNWGLALEEKLVFFWIAVSCYASPEHD